MDASTDGPHEHDDVGSRGRVAGGIDRGRLRAVLVGCATATLIAGCTEPGVTARAPSERPAAARPVAVPGPADACSFEDPSPWGHVPVAPSAVAVAAAQTATMVIAARDPDHLLALVSRGFAEVVPALVPMPGSDSIVGLEAVEEDRFVVLTRGACPASSAQPRCLFARVLDARAHALSDAVPIPLSGELRSIRAIAVGASVWVGRAHHGAGATLDRLDVGVESGLAHTVVSQGPARLEDEGPSEVLGLAVTAGSWAWLVRDGAAEDARSRVVLHTQAGGHPIEALHDALVVESMQWSSGTIALVAAFEFSRPLVMRFGADGRPRSAPTESLPGIALPSPFTERRSAALVGRGREAAVAVRDGAGDAVGEPAVFGADDLLAADVARRGPAFVIASAHRRPEGADVTLQVLRCRDAGPGGQSSRSRGSSSARLQGR